MRLQLLVSLIVMVGLCALVNAGDEGGGTPTTAIWDETTSEDAKVTTDETEIEDTLGSAIAADAGTAVVGASHSTALGAKDDAAGQAFVFTRDTSGEWELAQELVPSEGSVGDLYGDAVAMDGEVIVVGAPEDDDAAEDAGAVYVFRYDADGEEWVEEEKLTASDAAEDDLFGFSVAVDGNQLLVGAQEGDGESDDSGTAYYFEYDPEEETWTEVQVFTHIYGERGDGFGVVDLEDGLAVIGAPGFDFFGTDLGRIYIYRYNADTGEFDEDGDILGDEVQTFGNFGTSVATNGVKVAGGFAGDDEFIAGVAVFVFEDEEEVWDEEETLHASEGRDGFNYGASLAMFEDTILVGSPGDDSEETDGGSVYVYQPNLDGDWIEVMKLVPDEVGSGDQVGHSITFAGTGVLASAPSDDDIAADAGAFYSWTILPDCNGNGIADSQDVEDGISEDCNGNGFPDECDLDGYLLVGGASGEKAGGDDQLGGAAAAVSHGVALISSVRNDEAGASAGAVYAFARDADGEWVQEDRLLASDGGSLDNFGNSLGMDGALAVIGARNHDLDDDTDNTGAVYVFARDAASGEWTEVTLLQASDAADGDNFGYSADVAGGVIAVGARNRDEDGSNSGSVYVYTFDGTTWGDEQRVEADDADGGDRFGETVALDETGERMAIGAPFDDDDGSSSGAVYVFTTSGPVKGMGPTQEAKLTAPDAEAGDEFGTILAMTGDAVFVGVPEKDTDVGVNAGLVYVFRFDGEDWTDAGTIEPSDGDAGDNFGAAMAADGDHVIIGAPGSGDTVGAAYVFEYDGDEWIELDKLLATDPGDEDEFGTTVGLHGHLVLAGAPGWDAESGLDVGHAYGFAVADCNGNEVLDVCETADGEADDCNGDLIPDECQESTDPFVTWGPVDGEPCAGDEVTLRVAAVAGEGVAFQWQLDGEDLKGATATAYTIESFGGGDEGTYTCVVTDDCGEATSREAIVTLCSKGIPFIRGDANNDGAYGQIGDPIFLFQAGFLEDAPQPACEDAADFNGDGSISFLGDGLFGLNATFIPDSTPIPAPHPDCDVGEILISCDTPPDCS